MKRGMILLVLVGALVASGAAQALTIPTAAKMISDGVLKRLHFAGYRSASVVSARCEKDTDTFFFCILRVRMTPGTPVLTVDYNGTYNESTGTLSWSLVK